MLWVKVFMSACGTPLAGAPDPEVITSDNDNGDDDDDDDNYDDNAQASTLLATAVSTASFRLAW